MYYIASKLLEQQVKGGGELEEFNLAYIAERRKELGMTLDDMAKSLGFSGGSVYWKYERGIYKFNADFLPKLANALQCSISQFYKIEIADIETHTG